MQNPIQVDFDSNTGMFEIDSSQTKGFTKNALYRITSVVSVDFEGGFNGVAPDLRTQNFVFVR